MIVVHYCFMETCFSYVHTLPRHIYPKIKVITITEKCLVSKFSPRSDTNSSADLTRVPCRPLSLRCLKRGFATCCGGVTLFIFANERPAVYIAAGEISPRRVENGLSLLLLIFFLLCSSCWLTSAITLSRCSCVNERAMFVFRHPRYCAPKWAAWLRIL